MKRIILLFLTICFPFYSFGWLRDIECFYMPHFSFTMEWIKNGIYRNGRFSPELSRQMIFSLRDDIREKYGYLVDLNKGVEEAMRVIRKETHFSPQEQEHVKKFYFCLLGIDGYPKEGDMMLPDELSLGFVLILSGSLLSLVPHPFAQGLGQSLIVGGLGYVAHGAANGEKPYYYSEKELE